MQTEIINNDTVLKTNEPPVLPAPHFDENEIAAAQPVQPFADIRFRRSKNMLRQVTARRGSLIAIIILALTVSLSLAAAFNNWSDLASAKEETAESINEPATPETESAPATVSGKQDAARTGRRRARSNRLRLQTRPTFQFYTADDDGKPKARLVTVIH